MTESLAKLSSMLESARDLTIEAAASASSRLVETPSASRPKEISKLLNSRSDRDILSGIKCVISLIARGEDGLPYFADVVKNITSSNSKVKNLVLIYLTRYAEIEPDTALLSINSIQKSLNDKSPVARATAIRALAGIRISSIAPIVLLCVKRTITDPSPIVRSSTALAIGKVYDIENTNKKQLLEYLSKFLADSNSRVVNSAIKTYYKIMNNISSSHKRWEPIHGNFRRFCSILGELDEWSQSYLIDILTTYARNFLPRPKLYLKDESNTIIDLPDKYSQIPFPIYDVSMDDDLELFFNSLKPLVYSKTESIILSISKAVYSLAPPSVYKNFQINIALIRIATSSYNHEGTFFALQTIASISLYDQTIFGPYYKKFYVYPTDSVPVAKCKIETLSSLANENNLKYILEELKYYSLNSNENKIIANEAIKAIGRCSQISSEWNKKILKWCLYQIKITSGTILNELLTVIRYLIQQKQNFMDDLDNEKEEIIKTTYKLARVLQEESSNLESDAKASIIWIIGEFTGAANNSIGPDVLRLLIKNFSNESENVRYQVLVLASKIFSFELDRITKETGDNNLEKINDVLRDNIISKMFQHVLHLSKYDLSYDTRDRARMFNVLLNTGTERSQLASLFLQVPKPVPLISLNDSKNINKHLNKILMNFFSIIEWANPETLPPSSIRKEIPVKLNDSSSFGISSVSNKSLPPVPISEHAISSQQYHNVHKIMPQPKQAYKLQSLDEFFGGEDDSEEKSDYYEESSSEEDGEVESDEESDDSENVDEYSDSDASSTKGFIKK